MHFLYFLQFIVTIIQFSVSTSFHTFVQFKLNILHICAFCSKNILYAIIILSLTSGALYYSVSGILLYVTNIIRWTNIEMYMQCIYINMTFSNLWLSECICIITNCLVILYFYHDWALLWRQVPKHRRWLYKQMKTICECKWAFCTCHIVRVAKWDFDYILLSQSSGNWRCYCEWCHLWVLCSQHMNNNFETVIRLLENNYNCWNLRFVGVYTSIASWQIVCSFELQSHIIPFVEGWCELTKV